MKKNYIFIPLAFSIFTTAQVGINTNNPTQALDINGELRVRTLPSGDVIDEVLVSDSDGNVRKVPRNSFETGGAITDGSFNSTILGYEPQPIANKVVPATAPGGATVTELGCKQYPTNGHYYCAYQLSSGVNWFNSFEFAKSLGGYLVTLTNVDETDWVYSEMLTDYSLNSNIWIGYNKIAEPGNANRFRWITGEEYKINWATNPSRAENRFLSGEPNNQGGNEGSTHIIGVGGTCNRGWNDIAGASITANPSCTPAAANRPFIRLIVEFNN
jgi:hypothetical protein